MKKPRRTPGLGFRRAPARLRKRGNARGLAAGFDAQTPKSERLVRAVVAKLRAMLGVKGLRELAGRSEREQRAGFGAVVTELDLPAEHDLARTIAFQRGAALTFELGDRVWWPSRLSRSPRRGKPAAAPTSLGSRHE